jgi:hypothetical protein
VLFYSAGINIKPEATCAALDEISGQLRTTIVDNGEAIDDGCPFGMSVHDASFRTPSVVILSKQTAGGPSGIRPISCTRVVACRPPPRTGFEPLHEMARILRPRQWTGKFA